MLRHATRLVVLWGLTALMPVPTAEACSCGVRPACAAFWDAEAVFIARAEVTTPAPGAQDVRLQTEEWFRGPRLAVMEVESRGLGGSCDAAFEHGARYLVYAYRAPEGKWKVSMCSRTVRIDRAQKDIALARDIASGKIRTGTISGSAHVAEEDGSRVRRTISVLPGASLSVTGAQGTFSARTDSRGRFDFADVPPGRYQLSVRLPPNFQPVPAETLEVRGPGACVTHGFSALRK